MTEPPRPGGRFRSPYARHHLASHAAAGEVLDEVLTAENLPYLDSTRLSELLRLTQAPPHSSLWRLLSAWRTVKHRWSWNDPAANAAALDVALAAIGDRPPERRLTGLHWRAAWAEWMTGGTVVGFADGGTPFSAYGSVAGTPVVVVGLGTQVQLWEAATGQRIGEPLMIRADGYEPVAAVATGGDDGSAVVAVTRPGNVTVWDGVTGAVVVEFAVADGAIRSVATARVGERWAVVTAGGEGLLHVRSMDTGKEVMPPLPASPRIRAVAVAEARDGPIVAVGNGGGTVEFLSLGTRALVAAPIEIGVEVNAVALDTTSRLGAVVAVGDARGRATVWSMTSGEQLSAWEHGGEVRAIALGTAGYTPTVAAGCADGAVIVGPADALAAGTVLSHPDEVTSVLFGDIDGRTMVITACVDGNTRLWDPVQPSGARAHVDGRVGSVSIVERPDGSIDVFSGDDRARLRVRSGSNGYPYLDHDATGPTPVVRRKSSRRPTVGVAAGYVDGRLIALTNFLGNTQIWEIDEDRSGRASVLKSYPAQGGKWSPSSIFVGSGRALFVSARFAEEIFVVDAFSEISHRIRGTDDESRPAGFHRLADGVWLAVTSSTGVVLENVDGEGALGPAIPLEPWSPFAFGQFRGTDAAAVAIQGEVRVWDARSGEEITPPFMTTPSARSLAWARVGGRDVLLTSHNSTIRVWNPRTGREISALPFGTSIDVTQAHAAQDGRLLVVVGGPGVVMTELQGRRGVPDLSPPAEGVRPVPFA
jgi:WD40 repeat protein